MNHIQNPLRKFTFCFLFLPAMFSAAPVLYADSSQLQAAIDKAHTVVNIETVDAAILGEQPQGVFDKSTGRFLILRRAKRVASMRHGSGIIIDASGVIVTNTHTVRDTANIFVTLFNGARVSAKLLHHVPDKDISFIKIDPPFALPVIEFANSDGLTIGMSVFAIGHAQWINGSITGGQIKSLGAENFHGASHITLLQIAFHSYQGDSGSPILDGNGRLIGMINAGQTHGPITYAISSNLIGTAYHNYLQAR